MNIDITQDKRQLIIEMQADESFVRLQDNCKFHLLPRIMNGIYKIPFIALPIIVNAARKLLYKISYTPRILRFHKKIKKNRLYLEDIKNRNYKSNDGLVNSILRYIKETQEEIKLRIPDFNFYSNQVETIVYGIIGERVIIGNEVGTGKTLASLMIARYLIKHRNLKKILIMLPASLVKNFYMDYMKFFNESDMLMIQTPTPAKRALMYQTFRQSKSLKFLITNYEKCYFDMEDLMKHKFDLVIVDEFHQMRNFMNAKKSINFFELIKKHWKPTYIYPMSGTPIENRLFDIYPIFKLLDDGRILGGVEFFEANFIVFGEKEYYVKGKRGKNGKYGKAFKRVEVKAVGFKNHNIVKELIKPYMIRKKLDLPVDCYRKDIHIQPTSKFMDKYAEVLINSKSFADTRQFLSDTRRYDWEKNLKYHHLENIITQTTSKVIVFSFYKCGISAIAHKLDEIGIKYYTCMGGDGEDAFDTIQKFKNDKNAQVLITTDKINYGHNMQFVQNIIEWEKPLKPSISIQRAGRAYRAGQDKDVHVYTFIISNTLEDDIAMQWEKKKHLIDLMINSIGSDSKDENLDELLNKLDGSIEDDMKKIYYEKKNQLKKS